MKPRGALRVLLTVFASALPLVLGFAGPPTLFARPAATRLGSAVSEEQPASDVTDTSSSLFPGSEILEFELAEHKPLGCTVEESLAHPVEKHVFVTKVVDGGFAQQAGLEVGDVLVAVSGIFGDSRGVIGMGIDGVRSLVTGRDKGEALELRVARGTDVMEQHESKLVDLCMSPGADNDQVEECVLAIHSHGLTLDDDDDDQMGMDCDDEGECLLDDMFNMWNEDLPPSTKSEPVAEVVTKQESAPAPWSSRSSPSGTYVRDPATGEMRNTDG